MRKNKQADGLSATERQLDDIRVELDILRSKVHAVKVAYLNSAPFEGQVVSFEDLQNVAKQYIQKSYEYQKARYGAIKVRIPMAKLLRRG